MSELVDISEGIDIEDTYVITREDPKAPIGTREYRTSRHLWSKEIEDAKLYVDLGLVLDVKRFIAKNDANFLKRDGYAISTRFGHPKLGDVIKQIFSGEKDVVALTQGITAAVYQPGRDYRDFRRIGDAD